MRLILVWTVDLFGLSAAAMKRALSVLPLVEKRGGALKLGR